MVADVLNGSSLSQPKEERKLVFVSDMVFLVALGEGLDWQNFFTSPSGKKGDMSVGLVWVMFIVDSVLYSIVTWYIDSIMPGKYGVAKPWYFFIMV
jgi:hypothetical protein